ncbi:MAG: ComEC/Rec2 family competence protein [Cyanobacteria bacterium P01_G01_bin.19]
MTRNSWIAICLAYIVGLLCTNLFTVSGSTFTTHELFMAIALACSIALTARIALHQLRIPSKVWFSAAIVAVLAILYFQLRIPQPDIQDIVYQVSPVEREMVVVRGKVVTEPRLNASGKIKFLLKAEKFNRQQTVSGKLYATLPLLEGTGINLGSDVELQGFLYTPQTAIAGGFDFKAYLARQGIFAGMQALKVTSDRNTETNWGFWQLRRRIVRSQLQGLGSPIGQLVSSMVLGRKAVDLPLDMRDRFIQAGLAHVLAASGFHVSLLLGLILRFTSRMSAKPKSIVGVVTLAVYLGLTGVQASVLRACLMGTAVLLAIAMETKVRPLGSLLLAATLILLFDPLLIGDLGFQLSFLATFGLIVTMPGLKARLDWLPPTIATLVAVPLAASIWVLPLLCYQFNLVATYSIVVNILCTPLIMAISIGGMVSAIAALILPIAGSAIAWLLLYPTLFLIAIIDFFINLPGSSWAIGNISLGVLLIIYALLTAIWLQPKWGKYWRRAFLFILTIIIVPIGYRHFNLTQIAILPTKPEPAIVIQDRGKVILIDSGTPKTFQYTVLPFLIRQGINHLDYHIALDPKSQSNIKEIAASIPTDKFITQSEISTEDSSVDCAIATSNFRLTCDRNLPLINLETASETWAILFPTKSKNLQIQDYIEKQNSSDKPLTIVASSIPSDWMELNPQNIITLFVPKPEISRRNIYQPNIFDLKQDGLVIWTPKTEINQTSQRSAFNSIF